MKLLVKLLVGLVLIFVILGSVALLLRNSVGARLTESTLSRLTGMSVTIDYLFIKLTLNEVTAKKVTILNPPGEFEDKRAISIDELQAEFEPMSLVRGQPHFSRIYLNIPTVAVIRNKQGEINLKRLQAGKDDTKESRKFQLDELVLTMGEVVYIDEGTGGKPLTYHINVRDRVYRNIDSPADIKKIVLNLIVQTLPGNLLNFGGQLLEKGGAAATEIVGQDLKEAGDTAGDLLKEGGDALGGLFGGDDEEKKD